jgi:hypothetical protein
MKKKFEQQLAHLLNLVEQSVEVVPDKCLVAMLRIVGREILVREREVPHA